MSTKLNSLGIQGEVGGPEEDRTPDLLIANDVLVNNIKGLPPCNSAESSTKSQCVGTEKAQWKSVLTERPTDHRQPMDMTVLGYAMALGLAVLIGVGIWYWLRPKVRSGESNGSDPQI